MVALAARSDDGVEMLRRGRRVELFDGFGVQRGMFPKMRIQHACIGGFMAKQIMDNQLLLTPIVIGVGHGRGVHDFQLAVHGHHDRGQCRRAVGLVGGQFRSCT